MLLFGLHKKKVQQDNINQLAVAAALLLNDSFKMKNWRPSVIVFVAFVFSDREFHDRYLDVWQAIEKFIVNTFYS